jgi:uncharacterized protein (DUF58 family)
MEFRDFRAYVPGDDPRRVDWNLYRRSGRLFLRLFEEPEDLPVYILLDVSDSMFFEPQPRADAARLMAGVVAATSTNQHDRVGLYPFAADLLQPFGPVSGPRGLQRLLNFLERQAAAGPTDLAASLARFGAMRLRGGLAVVISDFFDAGGLAPIRAALQALPHRLLIVQVVRVTDAAPDLDGELTLVDCESGAELVVSVGPAMRRRHQEAYASFCDSLMAFAAGHRAAHLRLDADRPVLKQLGGLFPNGVFVT